jgi:hypothetical protein
MAGSAEQSEVSKTNLLLNSRKVVGLECRILKANEAAPQTDERCVARWGIEARGSGRAPKRDTIARTPFAAAWAEVAFEGPWPTGAHR